MQERSYHQSVLERSNFQRTQERINCQYTKEESVSQQIKRRSTKLLPYTPPKEVLRIQRTKKTCVYQKQIERLSWLLLSTLPTKHLQGAQECYDRLLLG